MTRGETPLDAAAILRVLAEHEVDYVVIGGLAVQAHGHTRTTQDLDVVPDADPANLARLEAALRVLGAHRAGAPDSREPRVPGAGTLALDTAAGALDIHLDPPGVTRYRDLRAGALNLEVAGVTVRVAGRDDLIAMKRASGRPIDRGDVIALSQPEKPA